MPEMPDVVIYVEALDRLLSGQTIENIRVRSPFVLRTFAPPIEDLIGQRVRGFTRCGKRIVWELERGLYLVVHPMIAGRWHWKRPRYAGRGKHDLIAFEFAEGVMMLTEVSHRKRAGVWVCASQADVDKLDPGGLDVLTAEPAEFQRQLQGENRTLKRVLADPRKFDGIGNAYGDEILHAAQQSPLKRTSQLNENEVAQLYEAARATLSQWIERLREQTGDSFPERVTAFRPEMAVHGKFGQSCPTCGATVQRIRYAENECNYCPGCQTGGRIFSDRSLARLLKDDWPKTLADLEET